MKKFVLLTFMILTLIGCSSINEIKVKDYNSQVWLASSDGYYDFQGKFVTVYYSGVKTVGLQMEEPLGEGWKRVNVRSGDIWLGMVDLIYLKAEDWKQVWTLAKARINKASQESITVGILKKEKDGSYEKELKWFVLKPNK